MLQQLTLFPLPKKPFELNNLTRIVNFDMNIEGMHFIATKIEDNMTKKKHLIHAFRQDVKEDRTSFWKNSNAYKIRTQIEVLIPVRLNFLIPAGQGSWSSDLNYAMILPDKPENLPPFIKQFQPMYNSFSLLIKDRITESAQMANLESGINQLGEHIAKNQPDKMRIKFMNDVGMIVDKVKGLVNNQPVQVNKEHPEKK